MIMNTNTNNVIASRASLLGLVKQSSFIKDLAPTEITPLETGPLELEDPIPLDRNPVGTYFNEHPIDEGMPWPEHTPEPSFLEKSKHVLTTPGDPNLLKHNLDNVMQWMRDNPGKTTGLAALAAGPLAGLVSGTFSKAGPLRGALRGTGMVAGAGAGALAGGHLGHKLMEYGDLSGWSDNQKALAYIASVLGGAGLGGHAGHALTRAMSKSDEEEREDRREKYASINRAYETLISAR